MRTSRILLSIVAILLPGLVAGPGEALAQAPQIQAGLILQGSRVGDGRLVYMWDNSSLQKDPIQVVLSLQNTGASGVLVPAGFSGKPFILFLVFTDPDGKGITATGAGAESQGDSHVPPVRVIQVEGNPVQVQPVENLPGTAPPEPGWPLEITLPNAHTYYHLSKAGRYSVKAVIPVTTYQRVAYTVGGVDYARLDEVEWTGTIESNVVNFSIVDDSDCDGYFAPGGCGSCPSAGHCPSTTLSMNGPDCDDLLSTIHPGAAEIPCNGRDDDCNPVTPDQPLAMICAQPVGTIRVTVEKHTVGAGNYPGVSKQPLSGIPIRVFDKSSKSDAATRFGISWQNYPDIYKQCEAVVPMQITAVSTGTATFNVPGGDYLMIGEYDPNPLIAGDEIYIGNSVGTVNADETVQKYLQVIVKADQSLVPAKYVIKTGSELLIIMPEYVEWDQVQELYPFIFQTVGDWGITTTITPPEGFMTDHPSLSVEVDNTMMAVQFTVTDVGSDWVDTNAEYTVKHKNKMEKVKAKIGVKKKNKELK